MRFLSVQPLPDGFRTRTKRWWIRHDPTGLTIGKIQFTTKRQGREFVEKNLDPANIKWKNAWAELESLYQESTKRYRESEHVVR